MDNAYRDIEEEELKLLKNFYWSNASHDSRVALQKFYKKIQGPGGKARMMAVDEIVAQALEVLNKNWK